MFPEFGRNPERFGDSPNFLGTTLASYEHRVGDKPNQDAYFASKTAAGVFDGVGSEEGSENASRIAAEYCDAAVNELPDELSPDDAIAALGMILRGASAAITEYGAPNNISTAAIIMKIFTDPETRTKFTAEVHAGDCRCQILRDGKIISTSLDHRRNDSLTGNETAQKIQDYLDEATDAASIDDATIDGWSVRLAFDSRNEIASYLGNYIDPNDIPIRASAHAVKPGDVLLLTSDGIHDNLTRNEMEEICRRTPNPIDTPGELLVAANARSGEMHLRAKHDDMTALVVIVKD